MPSRFALPALLVLALIVLAVLGGLPDEDGEAPDTRPNVLFLVVDDLRPLLGCYGVSAVRTPRIDALAAQGTTFTRAYCQQSLCNPSRTSVLTGLRPETTGIEDLRSDFRARMPRAITLPQFFRLSGYHAVGMGKVFHTGLNDEASWSVPWTRPTLEPYRDPESQAAVARNRQAAKRSGRTRPEQGQAAKGPPTEAADVADEEYYDGALADMAIASLRELAGRAEPFFLAVGFFRPHLPFNAPKRYWDLYDPDALPLAPRASAPDDAPSFAVEGTHELEYYEGIPATTPFDEELTRHLIHGYFASVSYVDAQVGKVLDELARLDVADETIVVLWGDHGWKLGDYGEWGKKTNFEVDTRTPLIVRVPGHEPSTCSALVELIDLYPTLCDLAGLDPPDFLEGTSMRPLLEDPARPWKTAAFSRTRRVLTGSPGGSAGPRVLTGVSMRTERYRTTLWYELESPDSFLKLELYDHATDPGETVNLAARPEHRELCEELRSSLERGWRGALP